MSTDRDDRNEPPPEPPPSGGHIRTTSPVAVTGSALLGLVLGWAVRPVSVRLNGAAPTVGWLPVLALAFVALVVGSVAWSTNRSLHRRHERLEPHHAVNRLVLAKSCALAGAVVAGAYFVGGVAGVALVACSLLLERACRVSRDG